MLLPLALAVACFVLGVGLFVAGVMLRPPGERIVSGWMLGFLTNSTPLGKTLGLIGLGLFTAALVFGGPYVMRLW
jgi:hypothetical protein